MSETLRRAWNDVAQGYERYFVPRFAPWVSDAIAAVPDDVPPGAIAVPCCGTGPELVPLAERFPDRAVIGVDLSERMLEIAAARSASHARVRVARGDATALPLDEPVAAVVSVFGLQHMAEPARALGAWIRALAPGGVASVMFWPRDADGEDGPLARLRAVVAERVPPEPARPWEHELAPAAVAAHGHILRDERVMHVMTHPSPRAFVEATLNAGPWRALVLRVGEPVMTEIAEAFVARSAPGPLEQHAVARHLVAARL